MLSCLANTYKNCLSRNPTIVKEFVLVEFVTEYGTEAEELRNRLRCLGDDFQLLKDDYEYETDDEYNTVSSWIRVSGRINAMRASMVKLQDSFLAERMRISYIPDDLKDKYRK